MNTLLKPFYAVIPLSLEELFAEELKKLGIEKFRVQKGGCWFGAEMNQMMKVNLWTRYASRILLKLSESPYRSEDDIYRQVKAIKWEQYFKSRNSIKVEVSARHSPLRSLNFATLRVKDAVCDYFTDQDGERPDVDKHNPDIQIYVHLNEKSCIVYLDTSGESLFKRGWREAKGEAPLKENLAAGLLGLASWEPSIALQDPFCGSGTILIEAATIAANIAPGINRRFGFEKFVGFDSNAWQQMKKEARMAVNWDADVNISGSDISTLIVDRAGKNAELAGLGRWLSEGKLRFSACDAREVLPSSETPGLIVANPPYGEQSNPKSASVASMMKDVADNLKHHFAGWTVWMLTSDRMLPRQMRLSESRKIVFFNGPLECRFFRFNMTAGSNRRKEDTKTQDSVNKSE
ncbi:THUMP domain-containing protein [uncultured Parasutterella sp.]|uniref:THUMP domain-containing class I SAM-dependent RNA methyltransferase n=1 Tax=uncultured Parasutterella sp. TaxID=1263098 RepID=UPI0025B70201|nr:THUMP domain-containing protein [uncultured Parasutterella sp.]